MKLKGRRDSREGYTGAGGEDEEYSVAKYVFECVVPKEGTSVCGIVMVVTLQRKAEKLTKP